MKAFKFPNILSSETTADYFSDFVSLNKADNKDFSIRKVSLDLKWPFSLISDLVSGRKPLTAQRAIEFSRFANLTTLETDRLVWMSLVDTGDEYTKKYFNSKLSGSPSEHLKSSCALDNFDDLYYVSLCSSVIFLKQKFLRADEIIKILRNKKIDSLKIENALKIIKEKNIISYDNVAARMNLDKDLTCDNEHVRDGKPFVGIEFHAKHAENFLEFTQNPCTNSAYNSGVILIKKNQFLPFALQLISIRNSFIEMSHSNIKNRFAADIENEEPCYLMQMDLNLFRINEI